MKKLISIINFESVMLGILGSILLIALVVGTVQFMIVPAIALF